MKILKLILKKGARESFLSNQSDRSKIESLPTGCSSDDGMTKFEFVVLFGSGSKFSPWIFVTLSRLKNETKKTFKNSKKK